MAKTKNKPNKGLVKRVKVTATGRVKMRRPGNRHLRSHKTADAIRGYRLTSLASEPDMMKLRRVLGLKRPKLRYAERIAESATAETPAEPARPVKPAKPAKPSARAAKTEVPVPAASTGRTRKTRGSAPADER